MGKKANKCFEGVIVPTALYGADAWGKTSAERRKDEMMHSRARIERELVSRAYQRVLRLFGHVERMDKYCMVRKVLMAELSKWRTGTRWTEVRLDGWCEGGLGQQKKDGGGGATMRETSERVESPCR